MTPDFVVVQTPPVPERILGESFSHLRKDVKNATEKLNKLIESRDRVDISLKEYEELKRVNKDLLDRLRHAEHVFSRIGIAADMIPLIDPDSVKMYSAESYDCGPMIRKRRFRIEFVMEEY